MNIELNKREAEVMCTLLSSEIMKIQFHYGNQKPERLRTLYGIRDKIVKGRGDE